MKRKGIFISVLMVLSALLFFPTIVNDGSREGLILWFSVVLPALLPFMIFSGVMLRLGVASVIGRLVYPLFHRMLGLSANGCYAFVIGWLSGYPMGAKTAADLYREGEISRGEAQYLLSFCNNASPMFMVEYMGVYCLGLKRPWILPSIIYFTALLNAWIHKKRYLQGIDTERKLSLTSGIGQEYPLMEVLDESILDAFVTVTKVGGYIMLFSIMAHFLEQADFFHGGMKLLGLGIIEIATGGEYLKKGTLPGWSTWVSGCVITAFGGLSSVAQTFGVVCKTDLSRREYLAAKAVHSLLTAAVSLLWYIIFW